MQCCRYTVLWETQTSSVFIDRHFSKRSTFLNALSHDVQIFSALDSGPLRFAEVVCTARKDDLEASVNKCPCVDYLPS